jgi:hypothetical protein
MEVTLRSFALTILTCAAVVAAQDTVMADDDIGIRFQLPVACDIGTDCFIQNYVDRDASGGISDYACGSASYNGHTGTDFRTRTVKEKVDVIAAAGGKVAALRDGVADKLLRTEAERASVDKVECGNGVLIQHEGGIVTQYCHMKKGSIAVKVGDEVQTGQRLGEVGYSGMTEFPHVHFEIRKAKTPIDPFDAEITEACDSDTKPLWAADALEKATYGSRSLLSLSFTDGPVELTDLVEGKVSVPAFSTDMPALVGFGWMINLKKDDVITIVLTGPQGVIAENSMLVQRNSAERALFAGKKRPENGWPNGTYETKITVRNEGKVLLDKTTSQVIP